MRMAGLAGLTPAYMAGWLAGWLAGWPDSGMIRNHGRKNLWTWENKKTGSGDAACALLEDQLAAFPQPFFSSFDSPPAPSADPGAAPNPSLINKEQLSESSTSQRARAGALRKQGAVRSGIGGALVSVRWAV
ncbi:hypothetical protein DFJ73DRAFT_834034 [Zopfochytrium polystomum]|nr:hypothetical protein DFJ73DRAFT_834034 [Zopfochytrium polystomum]